MFILNTTTKTTQKTPQSASQQASQQTETKTILPEENVAFYQIDFHNEIQKRFQFEPMLIKLNFQMVSHSIFTALPRYWC